MLLLPMLLLLLLLRLLRDGPHRPIVPLLLAMLLLELSIQTLQTMESWHWGHSGTPGQQVWGGWAALQQPWQGRREHRVLFVTRAYVLVRSPGLGRWDRGRVRCHQGLCSGEVAGVEGRSCRARHYALASHETQKRVQHGSG